MESSYGVYYMDVLILLSGMVSSMSSGYVTDGVMSLLAFEEQPANEKTNTVAISIHMKLRILPPRDYLCALIKLLSILYPLD